MQYHIFLKSTFLSLLLVLLSTANAQTERQTTSTMILSSLLNIEYEFYAEYTTRISQEELIEFLEANGYLPPDGLENLRAPLMIDFPTDRWKGLYAKFAADCGWIETYAIVVEDEDGTYQEIRMIIIPADNECRDFYVEFAQYQFGAQLSGDRQLVTTSQYACFQNKKYLPREIYGCYEYVVLTDQTDEGRVINTCTDDADCVEGNYGPVIQYLFME